MCCYHFVKLANLSEGRRPIRLLCSSPHPVSRTFETLFRIRLHDVHRALVRGGHLARHAILGIQRDLKLSQDLGEVFNHTAFELLCRSVEGKVACAVSRSNGAHHSELHEVLGHGGRGNESSLSATESFSSFRRSVMPPKMRTVTCS